MQVAGGSVQVYAGRRIGRASAPPCDLPPSAPENTKAFRPMTVIVWPWRGDGDAPVVSTVPHVRSSGRMNSRDPAHGGLRETWTQRARALSRRKGGERATSASAPEAALPMPSLRGLGGG